MWVPYCAYQRQGDQIIIKAYRANDDSFGDPPCNDNQNGGYEEEQGHDLDSRRDTFVHDSYTDEYEACSLCDPWDHDEALYRYPKEVVYKCHGIPSRDVKQTSENETRNV